MNGTKMNGSKMNGASKSVGGTISRRRSCIIAVCVAVLFVEAIVIVKSLLDSCYNTKFAEEKEVATVPSEVVGVKEEDKGVDYEKLTEAFIKYPGQRVWDKWDYSKNPFPCLEAEESWFTTSVLRSPSQTGILFVRNMKTGSSTVGGISIRIARAMARKTPNVTTPLCKVRFDHSKATDLAYKYRDRKRSFLFSFVRDPTKRAVSEFFHFGVSRFKQEPSDANFKKYLMDRPFLDNYYLFDMSVQRFDRTSSDKTAFTEAIMKDYDFVGVTERMDESLVVMKMLLDLDLNDILYLTAKGSGGYDDGAYKGGCHYIIKSFVSPGMKKFFASETWQKRTDGDLMLFNSANRSLDLTIDALGREEFNRQLEAFQKLKEQAHEFCQPSELIYPCTNDGNLHRFNHTCLWWDSGCGYRCLDHMKYGDERDPKTEGVGWVDDIKQIRKLELKQIKHLLQAREREAKAKAAKESAKRAKAAKETKMDSEQARELANLKPQNLPKKVKFEAFTEQELKRALGGI